MLTEDVLLLYQREAETDPFGWVPTAAALALLDHIDGQDEALADLRARIAALEASRDELIEVEAIYWRALTDVLIGAQQQSQSHADVIALVAGALTEASAIMPLEKRAALPPPPVKEETPT